MISGQTWVNEDFWILEGKATIVTFMKFKYATEGSCCVACVGYSFVKVSISFHFILIEASGSVMNANEHVDYFPWRMHNSYGRRLGSSEERKQNPESKLLYDELETWNESTLSSPGWSARSTKGKLELLAISNSIENKTWVNQQLQCQA